MSIRIVLAEDGKAQRSMVRGLLAREPGMEVVGEAVDGKTAVELSRQLAPDIVLLDINMPGMNCTESAARIRDGGLPTKVIAFSFHCDREFAEEMLRAGASGYLPKDCSFKELAHAVRTVAAGGIYVSPQVTGQKDAVDGAARGRGSPYPIGTGGAEWSSP